MNTTTDGANLLHAAATYEAHISLVREPLALRIEGMRGSIKKLKDALNSATKVSHISCAR